MLDGLEKKKERILYSNYQEPPKTTFIENKRLNKLGYGAIELNEQIEMFHEKIDTLNDRRKIINSLKDDCDFNNLFNKTIDCFDKGFLHTLINAYSESSNYTRSEISYWFNTLQFDNPNCSNKGDVEMTICHIRLLIGGIEKIDFEETDKFSKIIHQKFLEILKVKKQELEKGINSQYVVTSEDDS